MNLVATLKDIKESGFHPESKFRLTKAGIHYQETKINSAESRMQDCRRLPLQGVSRSCAVKFIIYIVATKDPSLCSFAGKAQHKFSGCELRIVIWKVLVGGRYRPRESNVPLSWYVYVWSALKFIITFLKQITGV